MNVWERHTLIRVPQESPPSIDFSKKLVVCAFMGQRPTTGYSIYVERIWTDGEHIFVEVVRRGPPEGFVVGEMITCPYVMVLIEKTDMPFVFHVVDENGDRVKTIFSEFPSTGLAITVISFLCLTAFMLKIKKIKVKE
ncbi:protease complex subunit PrcB family protein [Candidatus Bathyarchaeota archaeon]|nr:protease complex subunit PrcB family protein [Candidatus Bathyarchaeota archaeon]